MATYLIRMKSLFCISVGNYTLFGAIRVSCNTENVWHHMLYFTFQLQFQGDSRGTAYCFFYYITELAFT